MKGAKPAIPIDAVEAVDMADPSNLRAGAAQLFLDPPVTS